MKKEVLLLTAEQLNLAAPVAGAFEAAVVAAVDCAVGNFLGCFVG